MTDEALVERVARALDDTQNECIGELPPDAQALAQVRVVPAVLARAAISAINASGTHRVLPVVATEAMCEAGEAVTIIGDYGNTNLFAGEVEQVWSAMVAAAGEG